MSGGGGYVLGRDSLADLEDIWEYIAADNIDAADRWVAKLLDAFEVLGRNPGIGHKREDLTAYAVLFWPVGAYLVIYQAAPELPVEIVAVTHGGPRYSGAVALTRFVIVAHGPVTLAPARPLLC